jgi:hypothetical protein
MPEQAAIDRFVEQQMTANHVPGLAHRTDRSCRGESGSQLRLRLVLESLQITMLYSP